MAENLAGKIPNMAEMKKKLATLKEMADTQIEIEKIKARVTKAKYDALIAEGFTDAQALQLCQGK